MTKIAARNRFHGSMERMFAQMVSDRDLSREDLERMRVLLLERLSDKEDT